MLGSGLAALFTHVFDLPVAIVNDVATIPTGLPAPTIPSFSEVVYLLVPALSLALIGLVQGAAVAAAVPNPDGKPADASRNFIGQGAGNLVSGLFRGMPVGGSMSTSAMVAASGARTRLALFIAAGVMAILVLAASGLVGLVAMPTLAALLIVVGVQAIKPARIRSVMGSGAAADGDHGRDLRPDAARPGAVRRADRRRPRDHPLRRPAVQPPATASAGVQSRRTGARERPRSRASRPDSVVVLQPYGSVFFASAAAVDEQLPNVDDDSRGSVVILRMRGIDEVGLTFVGVLDRYLTELEKHGSTLRLVISSERVLTPPQGGWPLRPPRRGSGSTRAPSGSARRRDVPSPTATEWVRSHRRAD